MRCSATLTTSRCFVSAQLVRPHSKVVMARRREGGKCRMMATTHARMPEVRERSVCMPARFIGCMVMSIVNLGLIQTHATDDKADNLRRTVALIRQAAKRGAHVVCLQELFLTPYFCKREDTT